ncbi:MAG: NAD(+) kinase [Gammaproteobacteria bacterium]|nr:NAD(+) kinase [Gammaproteobacteria bacterium]
MAQRFSSIGLMGREHDPQVTQTLASLAAHLQSAGVTVLVDAALAPLPGLVTVKAVNQEQLCSLAELVIVVGGDGTLLKAAHAITARQVPLVGINLGRLGFLADIPPAAMLDDISAILRGDYQQEQRQLLDAVILRGTLITRCSAALNDVVVQKADGGRLIEFETHVDGHFVCAHHADGIIIATATGSTAYALSGGGSILHPALDAVTLVPICPHALGDRPIVVKSDSRIEIVINNTHGGRAQITCDGQQSRMLDAGDRVRIERSVHTITFIHPPGHDYYKILRTKLHWGRGSQQTPPR